MAKRKDITPTEWLVPMKFRGTGTAYVTASSAEEAEEMARRGNFHGSEVGETEEWQIDGSAEPND